MMGPSLLSEQQRLRSQRKRREEARNQSRHDGDEEGERCRVRAYAFGDHIRRGPHGVLAVVPHGGGADMNIVKGMLLRAVYGDDIAFDRVDWTTVQVFLLPDAEEIRSPGACGWGARRPAARVRGRRRPRPHIAPSPPSDSPP